MTADTITITAGRAERQGDAKDFAGPDGTYPVMLAAISDTIEEVSRQPKTLKNGKPDPRDDGKWVYRIWTIAIEDGEFEGQVLDKRVNARSTGPKSGQYGIISAFLGRALAVGEEVSLSSLVGRSALASILTNDNDYPFINTLMAAPQRAPAAAAPVATPATPALAAPVAAPEPAAAAEQPAAPLPF